MSAPITNMLKFGNFKYFTSCSRIACLRQQHKQDKSSGVVETTVPVAEYDKDDQGRVIFPKRTGFPKGLDIDPKVSLQCDKVPLVYPKVHAGIMTTKTPHLPEHLENNARLLLADMALIKNEGFMKDIKRLQERYLRRQNPEEKHEKENKFQFILNQLCLEEISQKNINPENMTDDETKKLLRKLSNEARAIYAKTTHHWKPVEINSDYAGLVFMAARLAPTYRILLQILHEIKTRDEDFIPTSVLNIGSGVGSVIWAANTLWKNKIFEYYCVESSKNLCDLAQKLLAKDITNSLSTVIKGVTFRRFIPSEKNTENAFSLVVNSYTLMEQASREERLNLISTLWKQTINYLVLVEYGTNAGYKLIIEARDFILKMQDEIDTLKGHVFAPCPHDAVCPKFEMSLLTKIPCTFQSEYRQLNFNPNDECQGSKKLNERYSYVIFKKGCRDIGNNYPRLTKVQCRHDHTNCEMCCPDGSLRHYAVTQVKPSKHLYRCSRYSTEGDFLPVKWPTVFSANDARHTLAQKGHIGEDISDDTSKNQDKLHLDSLPHK